MGKIEINHTGSGSGITLSSDGTDLLLDGTAIGNQTAGQIEAIVSHDNLIGFIANEHIDWSSDQGGTNINAGNYTNTVYTHPIDGVDLGTALTGATVISDVNVNSAGHVTGFATRNLTPANISAATAAQGSKADSALQSADIGSTVQAQSSVLDGTTASYTTAEETKLSGIETSATADQTAGEIEAVVNHDNLLGFVANEHIDWSLTNAANIHPDNYTDTNTTYVSSDFDHDSLTGFVANEHIDWSLTNAANIHPDNYTDTNTTYVSSDFDHDSLTGFVTNEHIDWSLTNAADIHPDNYTDTNTTYVSGDFDHDALTNYVAAEHIDWALTNAADIHPDNYTDTNTTYVSGDFDHDSLTGFVANEHIDWSLTNAANIHPANYTDTVYTHPSDGVDLGAALTGANVISDVTVNAAGHVTGFATRALTGSDIGINTAYVDALNVDADTLDGLDSTYFQRGVYMQTTTPATPLDGDLWFYTEDGSLFIYYDDVDTGQWVGVSGPSGGGAGSGSVFVDTGTYVYYGGPRNVGIGLSTPAYALDVVGTINASGDVIAYSDARLKTDVETIKDGLNIVKQMRGVTFRKHNDTKVNVGVIAQEVQAVLPEAVHVNPDTGYLSVAYGNIVGVLIEAVKSQQDIIDGQEIRLAKLEALVEQIIGTQ
jgi:O-glycosyl hydrolase